MDKPKPDKGAINWDEVTSKNTDTKDRKKSKSPKKNGLVDKIKVLPKKQKIIGGVILGIILLSIIQSVIFTFMIRRSDWDFNISLDNGESSSTTSESCKRATSSTQAKNLRCDKETISRLEAKEEQARKEKEACESQTSDDGMKFYWSSSRKECEKYETEESCGMRGLKIWADNCVTEKEYNEKKAAQEKDKQLRSDCEARGGSYTSYNQKCEITSPEPSDPDTPTTDTPSTPGSVEPSEPTTPSIYTISDACWEYGKKNNVDLTDYASDEIKKDGDYYQIIMHHRDKSTWKCWYNPVSKEVLVEKIYNW